MGRYQIRQGDCLEELCKLKNTSVDVIITSPPYNIDKEYNLYDDKLPEGEYLSFMREVFLELYRVLKEDGSFFLNISSKASNKELEFKLLNIIVNSSFCIQNHIVWLKSIAFDDDARGHYKPVNSSRFISNFHESVYHLTKNKKVELDKLSIGVPYKDKSNKSRYNEGKDLRCRGNVWFIPYETVSHKRDHPCPFPVKLPEYCIKLHGVERCKCVLDPFAGIGSALIAAKNLSIKEALGIEKDPEYVKVANKELDLNKNY